MEAHTDAPSNECPRCGNRLTQDASGNAVCPSCALRASRPSSFWESQGGGLLKKFLQTVKRILTEPAAFFREMPTKGGIGAPLAFALIVHWLGKLGSYIWGVFFGQALFPLLLRNLERIQDMAGEDAGSFFSKNKIAELSESGGKLQSLFGAASLALDPFLALVGIFVSTLVIFLGARLFITAGRDGAPSEITYESILRIYCYASAPVLLSFIPFLGSLVATVGSFVILVIGIREVYRSTTGRAIVVAAFMQIIFAVLLLLAVIAAVVIFASFFTKAL